jgi:hypothetical protein
MSEKIYSWLLRLYPSRFRAAHGEEALQLFRDRARCETGFFPRLRLWLDLLADLAISLPREYRYAEPALAAAPLSQPGSAAPSPTFFVLADESPRPSALVIGGILSLSAVLAFSALLSRVSSRKPLSATSNQAYRNSSAPSPASARRAGQNSDAQSARGAAADMLASAPERESATSPAAFAATMPGSNAPSAPGTSPSSTLFMADSSIPPGTNAAVPLPRPRDTANPPRASASGSGLADEHHRIIVAAVSNLNRYYVDPTLAREMSDALEAHEKNGDDNAAGTGAAFAALLTKQMRDVSHDLHLDLIYSEQPLPDPSQGPSPKAEARYRTAMQQTNCTFEKIAVLPNNIGYLKLNSFPDPDVCQSTVTAAMQHLNHGGALILDLRDNRGGFGGTVATIASYFFDHPTYFYNPRENTTADSWTRSPVAGNNLADKPVFVLTSRSTISAAEEFCYNLKMLKRATLVGETTGGAAHAGAFHRLDDHFGMGIPETKPINPYSTPDWEGTGVAPDVPVPAAQALQTAVKLAQSKSQKK